MRRESLQRQGADHAPETSIRCGGERSVRWLGGKCQQRRNRFGRARPNPVDEEWGEFWILGIQIPVVNQLLRWNRNSFDGWQSQCGGLRCAFDVEYALERVGVRTKWVQARFFFFRGASAFGRGLVGCFHPKQHTTQLIGRLRRLVMCMKDVHGYQFAVHCTINSRQIVQIMETSKRIACDPVNWESNWVSRHDSHIDRDTSQRHLDTTLSVSSV
jgi:hypothetical protein